MSIEQFADFETIHTKPKHILIHFSDANVFAGGFLICKQTRAVRN